jgi:hypothetical protein
MLVKDFIEVTLLTEIEQMTVGENGYATHPYIGFSLIFAAIEVLGACLDDNDWSKNGFSESRFRLAIAMLFPTTYCQYNRKENQHDLYRDLRCSLVHTLIPGNLISLSERKHEESAGVIGAHLTMQKGKLLLIYEDLLMDFKDACKKLIKMIEEKEIEHQKVYGHSISIPSDKINQI